MNRKTNRIFSHTFSHDFKINADSNYITPVIFCYVKHLIYPMSCFCYSEINSACWRFRKFIMFQICPHYIVLRCWLIPTRKSVLPLAYEDVLSLCSESQLLFWVEDLQQIVTKICSNVLERERRTDYLFGEPNTNCRKSWKPIIYAQNEIYGS